MGVPPRREAQALSAFICALLAVAITIGVLISRGFP